VQARVTQEGKKRSHEHEEREERIGPFVECLQFSITSHASTVDPAELYVVSFVLTEEGLGTLDQQM
jgi:hypothetical protein